MTTLNRYGAACRCLLRVRENAGSPILSDSAFIQRFRARYPDWTERPGFTDTQMIGEIAADLGLAKHSEIFRDYDQVLTEHRAGRDILVYTENVPEQKSGRVAGEYVMVLEDMNESHFTVWCPFPSGNSDTLPSADRKWWDQWGASALVLYPTPSYAGA